MADARLTAACAGYLAGRGLPSAAADVAALAEFVATQAAIEFGEPHASVAVLDPVLARQARRPR